MKFHLIYKSKDDNGNDNKIPELFKNACKERELEFVGYDMCEFGKSFTLSDAPKLGKGDLLYRSASSTEAITLERVMVTKDATTFHTDLHALNSARIASWFTHQQYGLPVVPTYPGIPSTKEEIESVVEKLGSFPIIIKVTGGSLGVGVMRIDSMKSLQSILDYLKAKGAKVMLRKYIPHDYYVRAVVVGDEVVASNATYVLDGEFRTNVATNEDQKRETKILPKEVQKAVVDAVRTLKRETGGVDLIFDKEENPYIAEVNFPNDFHTAQKVTKIDIAGKMIDYLIEKEKNTDSK